MTQAATAAVRKQIVVDAPQERAFTVFTENFGDFKPREHNLMRSPIARTVFEPHVGGHIVRRRRGRQRVPLGAGAGLRAARSGRVQLGHRPGLAARGRPGQRQRGRGALHRRDPRAHPRRARAPPHRPARARAGRPSATASTPIRAGRCTWTGTPPWWPPGGTADGRVRTRPGGVRPPAHPTPSAARHLIPQHEQLDGDAVGGTQVQVVSQVGLHHLGVLHLVLVRARPSTRLEVGDGRDRERRWSMPTRVSSNSRDRAGVVPEADDRAGCAMDAHGGAGHLDPDLEPHDRRPEPSGPSMSETVSDTCETPSIDRMSHRGTGPSDQSQERRCFLSWPRCFFASIRRSWEPRVGLVRRRLGGGGASAARRTAARRSRAACRLRSCCRCSLAAMVRTPSTSRLPEAGGEPLLLRLGQPGQLERGHRQLDPGVGGVDPLPAGARGPREPPAQGGGGHDEGAGDREVPGGVVVGGHAVQSRRRQAPDGRGGQGAGLRDVPPSSRARCRPTRPARPGARPAGSVAR